MNRNSPSTVFKPRSIDVAQDDPRNEFPTSKFYSERCMTAFFCENGIYYRGKLPPTTNAEEYYTLEVVRHDIISRILFGPVQEQTFSAWLKELVPRRDTSCCKNDGCIYKPDYAVLVEDFVHFYEVSVSRNAGRATALKSGNVSKLIRDLKICLNEHLGIRSASPWMEIVFHAVIFPEWCSESKVIRIVAPLKLESSSEKCKAISYCLKVFQEHYLSLSQTDFMNSIDSKGLHSFPFARLLGHDKHSPVFRALGPLFTDSLDRRTIDMDKVNYSTRFVAVLDAFKIFCTKVTSAEKDCGECCEFIRSQLSTTRLLPSVTILELAMFYRYKVECNKQCYGYLLPQLVDSLEREEIVTSAMLKDVKLKLGSSIFMLDKDRQQVFLSHCGRGYPVTPPEKRLHSTIE